MCSSKHLLVACILLTPTLNMAMPRRMSQVSPSVVSNIKGALSSNKPGLVLKHLHKNGLSINSQLTKKNETVLHFVAKLGKIQAAEMFLAKELESGKGGSVARVNVRNRDGNTPLDYVQNNGHTQLAELLQTYAQAELAALQNMTKPKDLFAAAANNDRAGAERLLAEGADPHEKKNHEQTTGGQLGFKTPFHIALEAEHYGLAAFLLKEALGINGLDEQGWTPLMLAIVGDDWDMVRELIVDGADIFAGQHENALDAAKMMKSEAKLVDIFAEEKGAYGVVHTGGKTFRLIELAASKGYVEVTRLLLGRGAAEVNALDMPLDENGNTPLILATKMGHTEVVELLITRGADVNVSDNSSWTPLKWAAANGFMDVAELLIENGADLDGALFVAATQRQMEIFKLLIDAEVNALDMPLDENGNTPLILATKMGHTEAVELLITRGADVNVSDNRLLEPWTPLKWATAKGHMDVAKLLIENGADLDGALFVAATHSQMEIIKFLIDNGAKPNTYVLGRAAESGLVEAVKLIIDKGDLNFTGTEGYSALLDATSGRTPGHIETVKFLINNRADLNITELHLKITRDRLSGRNKPEILKLLQSAYHEIASQDHSR